jgi:hypothetical protein
LYDVRKYCLNPSTLHHILIFKERQQSVLGVFVLVVAPMIAGNSLDAVRQLYERAHKDCRMVYDRHPSRRSSSQV